MAVGEWDRRELCPDGGCVGVIGPDGHCKVCGRTATNWGNERARGLKADAEEEEEDKDGVDADGDDDEYEDGDEGGDDEEDGDEGDDDDEDDDEIDAIQPEAPARLGAAAAWAERELCSDGGCIGVIGDDGTCSVCGKPGKKRRPAKAEAPAAAPAPAAETKAESDAGADAELERAADELAAAAAADAPEDDEGNRKLCPDGACVGVIGADGKCKVCGKDAA